MSTGEKVVWPQGPNSTADFLEAAIDDVHFSPSQRESLKLCLVPYLALMTKFEMCIPWWLENRAVDDAHFLA